MILLSVADDFSGANDLGGRWAGLGLRTYASLASQSLPEGPEAVIFSMESRLLGPAQAKAASAKAWSFLSGRYGAQACFHKMDSTLRGWPGQEILGWLEATGAPQVAFCAAYPRHGRQTRAGQQFVHGKRLDATEYARDPLSPARVYRPVDLFPKGFAVALRVGGLKQALQSKARVLCFDAATDADLDAIVKACLKAGIRHFSGASGLGAALGSQLAQGKPAPLPALPRKRFIVAGSVSETNFKQLRALEASGSAAWLRVSPSAQRAAFSTLQDRGQLKAGQARAERALQAMVRKALARVKDPAEAFWFLTGGHTAKVFCERLGLKGNWVLGELFPAVPLCLAPRQGKRPLLLSSKPGGFGADDTLVRIMKRGLK